MVQISVVAYKTTWSEKQEAGTEAESHREKSELAEDSSEGKQVKNEQEGVPEDSQLSLLFVTHIFQMCLPGVGTFKQA